MSLGVPKGSWGYIKWEVDSSRLILQGFWMCFWGKRYFIEEIIYFYMLFWIMKILIFIFMHGSNINFTWKICLNIPFVYKKKL